jgi:hypothetical protein
MTVTAELHFSGCVSVFPMIYHRSMNVVSGSADLCEL